VSASFCDLSVRSSSVLYSHRVYLVLILITTRRFVARPWGEAFDAMGCFEPKPWTSIRLTGEPVCVASHWATVRALAQESGPLISSLPVESVYPETLTLVAFLRLGTSRLRVWTAVGWSWALSS